MAMGIPFLEERQRRAPAGGCGSGMDHLRSWFPTNRSALRAPHTCHFYSRHSLSKRGVGHVISRAEGYLVVLCSSRTRHRASHNIVQSAQASPHDPSLSAGGETRKQKSTPRTPPSHIPCCLSPASQSFAVVSNAGLEASSSAAWVVRCLLMPVYPINRHVCLLFRHAQGPKSPFSIHPPSRWWRRSMSICPSVGDSEPGDLLRRTIGTSWGRFR